MIEKNFYEKDLIFKKKREKNTKLKIFRKSNTIF